MFNWLKATGRFHKLFLRPTPLRPAFAPVKASQKVWRGHRAQIDSAMSMIYAVRPDL